MFEKEDLTLTVGEGGEGSVIWPKNTHALEVETKLPIQFLKKLPHIRCISMSRSLLLCFGGLTARTGGPVVMGTRTGQCGENRTFIWVFSTYLGSVWAAGGC